MPTNGGHGRGAVPRLAFLYPAGWGDQEYYLFAEALDPAPVVFVLSTRLYGGEADHVVEDLLKSGDPGLLAEGARKAALLRPDALIWACTSASFVGGHDWALSQVAAMEAAGPCRASSTSLAFAEGLQALGIARVAIMATYPAAVAEHFAGFLEATGSRIAKLHCLEVMSGWDAGQAGDDALRAAVRAADHGDAGAVLVPDTAVATLHLLAQLEEELGKPVLSANQVSLWKALRLAGCAARPVGYGALFAC